MFLFLFMALPSGAVGAQRQNRVFEPKDTGSPLGALRHNPHISSDVEHWDS